MSDNEPISRRIELLTAIVLIVLWVAGSFSALRAEVSLLKSSPEKFKMSYYEKKLAMDGPVFTLVRKAMPLMSKDDKVFFFNPAVGDRGAYYYSKLRYYLAPIHVVEFKSPEHLQRETILEYDYLLSYIPKGLNTAYIDAILNEYPFLKPISIDIVQDGSQAIYMVGKDGDI